MGGGGGDRQFRRIGHLDMIIISLVAAGLISWLVAF